MRFAPSLELVNSRVDLSDSRVCFLFHILSAWYLMIRIPKDLRTGNQDGNIQFSPFQICNKPRTCKGPGGGAGEESLKKKSAAQRSFQEEMRYADQQLRYEKTWWVQDTEGTQRNKYSQLGWGEAGRGYVTDKKPLKMSRTLGRIWRSVGGSKRSRPQVKEMVCMETQRKENMRNIQNIQNPLFGWSTVIRGDKGATKVNCTWKVEEWARSAKGTDSEGKREPWGVWNEVLIWTWYFMQPLWQLCLEKRWAAGRQGRGLLQVEGGSYGEGERAPAVETLSSFEPNS